MFGWLSAIPQALGLASKGLDYFIKKADGDVTLGLRLFEADQATVMARRDVMLAGMNHPIWWIGWALFVFPLGIYWNKVILWDKVFADYTHGSTDPLTGIVAEWAGLIVLGLFGLQVGTGLAASLINKFARR